MPKTILKRASIMFAITLGLVLLAGCQDIDMTAKQIKEHTNGLAMTVRSYNENSEVIDEIKGESLMISRDTRFDTDVDSKDSSVVDVQIGKNEMVHVGSSLVIQEDGLTDIFDQYAKTVKIENSDTRGVPVLNKLMSRFEDSFKGKSRVILIRSQNGTPLATYAGNKVTPYSTDMPKATAFLIDGKLLIAYRCDYTVYDTALLDNN